MLSRYAKAFFNRLLTPPARLLLAMGIGPDVVTWIGTIGVTAAAFAFYPRGEFFVGTLVITAFVFSDTLDGTMARLSGRSSRVGGLPGLHPGPGRATPRSSPRCCGGSSAAGTSPGWPGSRPSA